MFFQFIRLFVILIVVGLASKVAQGKDAPKKVNALEALKYIEGNEKENETRALKTELLISASEKKAMQQAKMLLKKHRGTYLEPDLWFRMAELHMRKSKTERFFELHRESETVVSLAPTVVRKASAKREILKAIAIYERLQKRFRKFEKMDLVIFNHAFARQTIDQHKTAARLYWDLIKLYPYSPLVPDAHLAIGELKFEAGKFQIALEHFLSIEKYPQSRVYPYGMYKAAWSYYNLRKEDLALKKLEKVVAFGKLVEEQGIDARLDLRREALADMTIFFEDVYPSKKAYSYFSEQAGNLDVAPTLLRLGRLYERHSRYQDKLVVLTSLLYEKPKSSFVPEIHDQLVWNYENMKQRGEAVAQLEKYFNVCDEKSSWVKSQVTTQKEGANNPKAPAGIASECQKTMNSTSLKLAGKWLRTWKKNPDYPIFADSAEKAFAIYLRKSGVNKKSNKARFAYAELLFQRKKFRKASEQYAHVSGDSEQKQMGHDSAYAAIVSLEKAVGDKWNQADESTFHALATQYVTKHPKGKFLLDVQFKKGLIAYEKERYDEAGPIFLTLGRTFAKKEKGLKAQDLYLDILNIKKDYKGLTEYSKELLAKNASKERVAKLTKIHEEAWFLQVQNQEEKGQYKKAIAGYINFAKKNARSPLAEKALWNSTQLLYKTFRYKEAADSAVAYVDKYPKGQNAKDTLLKAAQTYESMGRLTEGATVLHRLAKTDAEQAGKWRALAADFLFLSGDYQKAKAIYKELSASQDKKVVSGALIQRMKIAKIENDQKTIKSIEKAYVRLNIQPEAGKAQLESLEIVFQSGQLSEAFVEAKKVLNMKDAGKAEKAKARFIQAQILEGEFDRQSLNSRAERVALVLQLKTGKLEKAQKAYQSAIRYGDPHVSVQAMMRLSSLYQKFVKELRDMPLPKGLSQQDEAVFRGEISSLSIPLEEKGVDTLARALESAKDLKLRDGTIAILRAKLDELNMKKDGRIKLNVSTPGYALPFAKGVGS